MINKSSNTHQVTLTNTNLKLNNIICVVAIQIGIGELLMLRIVLKTEKRNRNAINET